jgi:transposase
VKEVDAAALYESGLTLREVADRLSVSYETVRKQLDQQGVERRSRRECQRNRTTSTETRRKISEASKRRWADPTERAQLVAAMGGVRGPSLCGQKVTPEQYAEVMATKPDVCEVCGRPQQGRKKVLGLDHDHDTGELRGWLCHKCNAGIGMLGDDLDGIARADAYLRRTSPLPQHV